MSAMVLRDLRARLRDRSALVVALLAPATLMTVLSLVSSGPDQRDLPVGFVAAPASSAGRTLSDAVSDGPLASLADDGTLHVRDFPDRAALRRAVIDGTVDAGVAIAAAGDRIEVLRGDGGVIAPIILEAVAESSAVSLAGVGRAVVAETALGSVPDLDRLVRSIDAGAPSIAVRDATDRQGALSSSTSIAASMATLFLFFTAQFGVLGMLEERRTGTLARLFAAPVARWRVLAAKLAVSYVLGVGATAVLVAFSALLLGAEWGSLPGVVVLVLVGTLAAVSTSTLVLGVVTTAEQASAAQSMVGLVLGVVGGSFFSMTRAGGVAAIVTRLTPHHWFREGLVRLRSGGGIESLGVPVAALVAFAMVVGVPGLLLAARKVRP